MRWILPVLVLSAGACAPYRPYPQYDPPLTRVEGERLAAAGISEPVVIELVEKRGALKLSADDIVAIKQAGASDAVIQKMITHERQEPVRVRYVDYYDTHYCPIYHYHSFYCYPSFGVSYSRWHRRSGWGIHFGW